jgi:hypothetical protein
MRRLLLAPLLLASACTATHLSQVSQPTTNRDRVQFSTQGESSPQSVRKACDADCQRRRGEEIARLQQLDQPIHSELTAPDLLLPEPEEVPGTKLARAETSLASARAEAQKPSSAKARSKKASRPAAKSAK